MRTLLIFGIIIFAGNFVIAQKLTVVNIEELRSLSGSWDYCKVEVKPIGDEIRNYTYYKISDVKRAVDNKGLNLLSEKHDSYNYKPINENFTIQILKPSRSASTLSIDGTLSMYKPSESNGGIVKLGGFFNKPEVNFAPKGASYKLFYFDKATLKKKAEVDYMKRYEEIEKLPDGERNFASEVNSLVSGLTYYSEEDLEKVLFFAVGGDNSSILGFEFEDSKGKKIVPVSSSTTSVLYTYYFDQKPESTMKVVLNIESLKAVKKVPFSLLGVDLP